MTCQHQCKQTPCQTPDLCADFDEAHAVLMMLVWLALVFFAFAVFVFTTIYPEYLGASLRLAFEYMMGFFKRGLYE